MLDFVSFSTSDRRFFNLDPQRSNNVDASLKCSLGVIFLVHFEQIFMLLDGDSYILAASPLFSLKRKGKNNKSYEEEEFFFIYVI